jgi:hypothetical protein
MTSLSAVPRRVAHLACWSAAGNGTSYLTTYLHHTAALLLPSLLTRQKYRIHPVP